MGTFVTIICAIIFFYKYGKREARKIELMEEQVKLLETILKNQRSSQ